MEKVKIYTDGGARNNPGPAGIGVVILDENNNILQTDKEYIGLATNNEAEYSALIKALKLAGKLSVKEIEFFLDSELVVRQLNGIYKVKDPKMKKLFDEVSVLSMVFSKITYHHIRRELNKEADKLVNEAIDEELGIKKDNSV